MLLLGFVTEETIYKNVHNVSRCNLVIISFYKLWKNSKKCLCYSMIFPLFQAVAMLADYGRLLTLLWIPPILLAASLDISKFAV